MTPRAIVPQAFAALERLPALRAVVQASLDVQTSYVTTLLTSAIERPALFHSIEQTIAATASGLIALEGPAGSGVSTLLTMLAVRHPYPLWYIAHGDHGGAAALYAQIVALRRPALPLIDPAVQDNPMVLERLLAEIGQRGDEQPLVLLIDSEQEGEPLTPFAAPLPPDIPAGVVIVYGCAPGQQLPYPATQRIVLPSASDDEDRLIQTLLTRAGCAAGTIEHQAVSTMAKGNALYAQIAWAMLQDGLCHREQLPADLHGLYKRWWHSLDPIGRQMALALAAAGTALPFSLCAALCDADPAPLLDHWALLGLIVIDGQRVGLAHSSLASSIARIARSELVQQHGIFALLSLEKRGTIGNVQTAQAQYLEQHFARHSALAPVGKRGALLAHVTQRSWVQNHVRHGRDLLAAQESNWELFVAAIDGPLIRLIRAAMMAGNLAMQARRLPTEAVVAALPVAVEQLGREQGLKRVVQLVEQLPDGRGKAGILRQLGEACYGLRMRPSAMRLLSRALDLEEKPTSRSWREQRDQLLATLAEATINAGDIDSGLLIAAKIEHLERRAQVETMAVRQLLAVQELTRAQKVARAILHESMGEWARAEVGVALCRMADPRGPLLLAELTIETVSAWAQIELACDEAAHDEAAAQRRIAALPTAGQRDRGLARLAHHLALAAKDGDALAAAEQIADVEVRVAALLDLRLTLEGLVAMLALERATADVSALTGDARAPLLSSLAAAHAALGRRQRALSIVEQLAEGEERDRGLSKVAVAFARQGDFDQAGKIVAELQDEDERDWTLDELARLLGQAGDWAGALAMAEQIEASDQQARTLVELAISQARSGATAEALEVAARITVAGERARALTLIAPLLVRSGAIKAAQTVADRRDLLHSFEACSRYRAVLAAALAEAGAFAEAETLALGPLRPLDRARALLALAQAQARANVALAQSHLGAAMRIAAMGRDEAFRVIELATPLLGFLGGTALLREAALAVDEIDGW